MTELLINPEFKKLIPPLTPEEFAQLEQNCLVEGIRDAIVTWNGYIIDGHNRYEIAQRYDLEFKVIKSKFESENDVIEWMIFNQLGRRNLTVPQKDYLIGKRYDNEKQRHGGQIKFAAENIDSRPMGKNFPSVSTAEKIANEYGISDRQVKINSEFAKGLDLISAVAPEKTNEILLEKTNLRKQEVKEFSKLPKEAEKQIKQETLFITQEELKQLTEQKAKELAFEKLKQLEEEKKNHFAKVAFKIKDQNLAPQSIINLELAKEYQLQEHDVYLINNKHKLIIADSFLDIEFIKSQCNQIDCILTDPPYGVSYKSPTGSAMAQRGDYNIIEGDQIEFEPNILFKYCQNVITWGANHYANKLDNSAGWIVWDKREGIAINNNSDCELAWTNMINSARLFHHKWNGMIKASEQGEKRIHPTQKPVKLFEWCLELVKAGNYVLDLFAGSGITIIAAENTNRVATIVEKDISYASATLKRFELLGYTINKL
jgi:DNA modification methylase